MKNLISSTRCQTLTKFTVCRFHANQSCFWCEQNVWWCLLHASRWKAKQEDRQVLGHRPNPPGKGQEGLHLEAPLERIPNICEDHGWHLYWHSQPEEKVWWNLRQDWVGAQTIPAGYGRFWGGLGWQVQSPCSLGAHCSLILCEFA